MKTFIRVQRDFNLINDLSDNFSYPIIDNTVNLPPLLGEGFVKGFSFPSNLNLYVGHYNLNIPWELETINKMDTGAFCIFTTLISNQIRIKRGSEWVSLDKDSLNGLFFYSPGTSVKVRYPENEPFITVAITFTSETVNAIIEHPEILKGVDPKSPFIFFDETVPETENFIRKLGSLCYEDSSSKFEAYIALLNFMRLTLQRTFISKERYNLSGLLKEDIKKIFFIKRKLTDHSHSTPKLSVLSAEAGMSESKMSKLFKHVFDLTVYQYAQKARIKRAAELLSSQDYNVSEVGYLVGYTNMSHFAKKFKKYYKINPGEYLDDVLKAHKD